MKPLAARRVALVLTAAALAAAPAGAQQRTRDVVSTIARLPLPDRPQRSNDQEQETLALQLVDLLGLACRAHEMYRWRFKGDDAAHAQRLVAAGEKALKDKGYEVATLPVELDTLTALQARHANRALPDANVLALWYVGEEGVDLTLCRVKER